MDQVAETSNTKKSKGEGRSASIEEIGERRKEVLQFHRTNFTEHQEEMTNCFNELKDRKDEVLEEQDCIMEQMEETIENILKSSSKLKRFLKMGLFFLMSPFHPIILDTLSHKKLEEARLLAQNYEIQATKSMEQYRTLKRQLVTFIKIELGIFILFCFALICLSL